MLISKYPPDSFRLIPAGQWRPYPAWSDREAWESMDSGICSGWVSAACADEGKPWPALPARRYLDFARNGDRRRYESPYFHRRERLARGVMAECMEGRGRFLDEIADGVWVISEETSWCLPAHVGREQAAGPGLPDPDEPVVDLFAAETGALFAWTLYLMGQVLDDLSPLLRKRLIGEVRTRITDPCLARRDFWWMGFSQKRVNNWNPWINSNVLLCHLLCAAGPLLRSRGVRDTMESVDVFIDGYPADGGCDEGPGYWGRAGASLLDYLEILYSATAGGVDLYDEPLIGEIGRFICRVRISEDYYVNFADASALVATDPVSIYLYGKRVGDPDLSALGAWEARRRGVQEGRWPVPEGAVSSLSRILPSLFLRDEIARAETRLPLPRSVWLPGIQVLCERDTADSERGCFLAAKGGHNGESHNHNDLGSFVLYKDGAPVIIDIGVETYTRKTFSPERYDIWTMQSRNHTLLPRIRHEQTGSVPAGDEAGDLEQEDGIDQSPGVEFAARVLEHSSDPQGAELRMDLSGAYPEETRLESWERCLRFRRGSGASVEDSYRFAVPPSSVEMALITPCLPSTSRSGVVDLETRPMAGGRSSGSGTVKYNPELFRVDIRRIRVQDERLISVWGEALYRVAFCAEEPAAEGLFRFEFA